MSGSPNQPGKPFCSDSRPASPGSAPGHVAAPRRGRLLLAAAGVAFVASIIVLATLRDRDPDPPPGGTNGRPHERVITSLGRTLRITTDADAETKRRLSQFFVPLIGLNGVLPVTAHNALVKTWTDLPHTDDAWATTISFTLPPHLIEKWRHTMEPPRVCLDIPNVSILTNLELFAAQTGLCVAVSESGVTFEADASPGSNQDQQVEASGAIAEDVIARFIASACAFRDHHFFRGTRYSSLPGPDEKPDGLFWLPSDSGQEVNEFSAEASQIPAPGLVRWPWITHPELNALIVTQMGHLRVLFLHSSLPEQMEAAQKQVGELDLIINKWRTVRAPYAPYFKRVLTSLLEHHGVSAPEITIADGSVHWKATGPESQQRIARIVIQAVEEAARNSVAADFLFARSDAAPPESSQQVLSPSQFADEQKAMNQSADWTVGRASIESPAFLTTSVRAFHSSSSEVIAPETPPPCKVRLWKRGDRLAGEVQTRPPPDRKAEMEMEAAKWKSQLRTLKSLTDDELIQGYSSLPVKGPTPEAFYPRFQESTLELEGLLANGYGEKHPQIQGLRRRIAQTKEILRKSALQYINTLEVNLADLERQLKELEDYTVSMKSAAPRADHARTHSPHKLDGALPLHLHPGETLRLEMPGASSSRNSRLLYITPRIEK